MKAGIALPTFYSFKPPFSFKLLHLLLPAKCCCFYLITSMQPLYQSLDKTAAETWINRSMGRGDKPLCSLAPLQKSGKNPPRFVFHPWVCLWTNTWEERPHPVSRCQWFPRSREIWGEVLWGGLIGYRERERMFWWDLIWGQQGCMNFQQQGP